MDDHPDLREGNLQMHTDIAVIKERQLEFEERFDRHEEGEFKRYDNMARKQDENTDEIRALGAKLSGMNGWMVGFGSACAAIGTLLGLFSKKLFGF